MTTSRACSRRCPGRAEREPVVGHGEGGDDTTAIDAAAEEVILDRFRGEDVTLVSEEVGVLGNGRFTVVVDPIDGSLNAKRGIPFFSISIAVADGDTMDDVVFGYVYDFGTGEEWTATRGGGAFLNGAPLTELPKDELEILSFEATTTAYVSENAARFDGVAHRLRVMGSLAITLCHLAAGRVDGVVSLKGARSVDIAAAQLLVRERGLAIELPDAPPFGAAPLDLVGALASRRRRERRALRPAVGRPRSAEAVPSNRGHPRADPRGARPGDRPGAAPPGHRARHGARHRDRRLRRLGHDRADRRRLSAALELRGSGRRARRHAARRLEGDAAVST